MKKPYHIWDNPKERTFSKEVIDSLKKLHFSDEEILEMQEKAKKRKINGKDFKLI